MFLDLETKWRFGVKYAAFECRDFPNTYFSSSISWFSTGFWLFRPAEIRKRAGHGTLQKRQNMNTIKLRVSFSRIAFCEQSVFLILNFVKSPFFSHWILRRVRFSHIEFCEESVFLMLNFVKCPKTDSIFPLDRPLKRKTCWSY